MASTMPSIQLLGSRGAGKKKNAGAKKGGLVREAFLCRAFRVARQLSEHPEEDSLSSGPPTPLLRFDLLAPIFARLDKNLVRGSYCYFQYSSVAHVPLISKSSHFFSFISLPVLKERLDYTLREGYMESNYWSAVTSHVSYWSSCDVARFILENCLDSTQAMEQS